MQRRTYGRAELVVDAELNALAARTAEAIVRKQVAEDHADALLDKALPRFVSDSPRCVRRWRWAQSPEQIGEAQNVVDAAATHIGVAVAGRLSKAATARERRLFTLLSWSLGGQRRGERACQARSGMRCDEGASSISMERPRRAAPGGVTYRPDGEARRARGHRADWTVLPLALLSCAQPGGRPDAPPTAAAAAAAPEVTVSVIGTSDLHGYLEPRPVKVTDRSGSGRPSTAAGWRFSAATWRTCGVGTRCCCSTREICFREPWYQTWAKGRRSSPPTTYWAMTARRSATMSSTMVRPVR